MAMLVVINDGETHTFQINEGVSVIGRHPNSDIPLVHGTVSGKHAVIVQEGDKYYLEDVGSRNGTFVNGTQLSTRSALNHDDNILFGQLPANFVSKIGSGKTNDTVSLDGDAKKTVQDSGGGTVNFESLQEQMNVDFSSEAGEQLAETNASAGRFGVLDTQPEAKLQAVLDISTALVGATELNEMLPRVLSTLFGIFRYADRGCVLLLDPVSGKMIPRALKHRREEVDASVRLSRTIVSKVMEEKVGVLSADASQEFSNSESIADLKIRSMMCAPLIDLQGEVCGIISIDSQNPLGQFTKDDLDLLMVVAGQAALSYETTRLMESHMQKLKQDNEMEIAQSVQEALLPEALPVTQGWHFFASYDSAQAVGGDYYDSFVLPNGQLCLSFGDVAGKGVPGALIMARMSSCVQSTIKHVTDIEEAVGAINDHMCDSRVEGRFVTYVLTMIDTETSEVSLVNAGHMSPIIRRADGSIEQFEDDLIGPPIGVVEEYPYEADRRKLEPGDMVVIVTDGVDEAMNAAGDLYGVERTLEFVKNGPANASEMGRKLLADVRSHAAGRAQNDDITIMTFGREA